MSGLERQGPLQFRFRRFQFASPFAAMRDIARFQSVLHDSRVQRQGKANLVFVAIHRGTFQPAEEPIDRPGLLTLKLTYDKGIPRA